MPAHRWDPRLVHFLPTLWAHVAFVTSLDHHLLSAMGIEWGWGEVQKEEHHREAIEHRCGGTGHLREEGDGVLRSWRTCLFWLSCASTAWKRTQHLPGACRKPGRARGTRVEQGLLKNPTYRAEQQWEQWPSVPVSGSASHFPNLNSRKLQTSAKF